MRHEPGGYSQDIPATPAAVRLALADLQAALTPLSLTVEERATVELVLAEALNNIVEHAYAGMAGGRIGISVLPAADGLHCRLSDSGAPMPEGRAPLGNYCGPGTDLCDQPESGFGWFLIRNLARDPVYRRVRSENVLSFRIAVTRCGTAV